MSDATPKRKAPRKKAKKAKQESETPEVTTSDSDNAVTAAPDTSTESNDSQLSNDSQNDSQKTSEEEKTMETETTTSSTETETPKPKKRGVPKGTKRGPRPTVFVLASMQGEQVVLTEVNAKSHDEAREKFKDDTGREPLGTVMGPYMPRVGSTSTTGQGIVRDMTQLKFNGLRKYGVHRGYNVILQLVEEADIAFAIYMNAVEGADSENAAQKKPQPKVIKLSEVESLSDEMNLS